MKNTKNIHPIDKKLGQRIKQIRQFKNITCKELADDIGVSPQKMIAYENGTDRLGILELMIIASAFRLSASYLLMDLGSDLGSESNHLMLSNVMVLFDAIKKQEHKDAVYTIMKELAGHSLENK